jgi:hypothetical protein
MIPPESGISGVDPPMRQNSSQEFKLQIRSVNVWMELLMLHFTLIILGVLFWSRNEIANEIKRFSFISGYGGALVAPRVLLPRFDMRQFEMAENGQYMYHKPMGKFKGNEE